MLDNRVLQASNQAVICSLYPLWRET